MLFPTAEHCYQAQKFLPHRPDLAELIRGQPSPQAAVQVAEANISEEREDWIQVHVEIMEDVLRAKYDQNPSFAALLRRTGTCELVHDGPVGGKHLRLMSHAEGHGFILNRIPSGALAERERVKMNLVTH
jgi:predicted NAD-dependent protein-ADP-ribosyltransferase YbiA (DUF1768 family)